MNGIVELDGTFEVLSLDIGRGNENPSTITMRCSVAVASTYRNTSDHSRIWRCAREPRECGSSLRRPMESLPEDFYSTTNLETYIRLAGQWRHVEGTEMDLGVKQADEVTQTLRPAYP